VIVGLGIVIAAILVGKVVLGPGPQGSGTLRDPIVASQQTALDFGERSHWLQPWRAYLDTVPAQRLRDAVGINFNVGAAEAPATARLLARSGFKRARVETGWGSLSYDRPGEISNVPELRAKLEALKANGIRPLILLNANHGAPCPLRAFSATITAPAAAGARTLSVDATTAAAVVPGKTGLNALDGRYKAADILFTAVDPSGTATLSKPLPRALAPGPYPASTLRYPPFSSPLLADRRPNPEFEATMRGWLAYVGVVTREVKRVVGGDDFDVEVWNELTFGSDFLDRGTYYDPPVDSKVVSVDSGDPQAHRGMAVCARARRVARRHRRRLLQPDAVPGRLDEPARADRARQASLPAASLVSPRGCVRSDTPARRARPTGGPPRPARRVARRVRPQLHRLLPRVRTQRDPDGEHGPRPVADPDEHLRDGARPLHPSRGRPRS